MSDEKGIAYYVWPRWWVYRVGNRTSDARYNRTPLLGICVRHLSDNATGLKDRYHSHWVSIFTGVPPSLSFL